MYYPSRLLIVTSLVSACGTPHISDGELGTATQAVGLGTLDTSNRFPSVGAIRFAPVTQTLGET
jgi:hypothetical protein